MNRNISKKRFHDLRSFVFFHILTHNEVLNMLYYYAQHCSNYNRKNLRISISTRDLPFEFLYLIGTSVDNLKNDIVGQRNVKKREFLNQSAITIEQNDNNSNNNNNNYHNHSSHYYNSQLGRSLSTTVSESSVTLSTTCTPTLSNICHVNNISPARSMNSVSEVDDRFITDVNIEKLFDALNIFDNNVNNNNDASSPNSNLNTSSKKVKNTKIMKISVEEACLYFGKNRIDKVIDRGALMLANIIEKGFVAL